MLQPCKNGTCPQTYAASYPGSGAELFRALIEAISGYTASEVYKKKNLNQHFLVKTHGPMLEAFANKLTVEPDQAIYLIRNPLWSLPSFFNFEHEQKNNLQDHSVQAPEEKWLAWRDKHFAAKHQQWHDHVEYWADHMRPEDSFVIPYEGLTSDATGPLWTHQVGQFLEKRTGVPMANATRIGCIWKTVVKGGKSKKRGAKTYVPNFSETHLGEMLRALQELKLLHSGKFPVLGEILQEYIAATNERLKRNGNDKQKL